METIAATIPACPVPRQDQATPTRFIPPAQAVDSHAHVIGSAEDCFMSPLRSYDAPPAALTDYLGMLDATGIAFGVLVQVSIHGTDNSLMLKSLRSEPQRLRGVAVVAPDIGEKDCAALKEAGVVGLRINTLFGGGRSLADLHRYSDLCFELGWHLQLLIDGSTLPDITDALRSLRAPLVFDHLGQVPIAEGANSPAMQALRSLLADGAWVKLSGAYRVSAAGFPYGDTVDVARSLIDAAPDRCVWGSDWPHVATWTRMPNAGELLDVLAEWAPDEKVRNTILVDNPKRLYGF